ncbi:MAG: glutamate racemase [Ruminococcus sp.]|nr:glutamate racemase [Ruminococcus sp.]
MQNLPIGVFDSGLGGLTCVKELNALMPFEDIVYFGDTARIPYGTRSRETVMRYAAQDIEFVKKHNVKMIIAACGTVSSVSFAEKNLAGDDMLFTGVVIPAAQAACAATRNKKVGVIGTQATIKTGAYGKAMRAICQDITVIGKACPMFVPLVENGYVKRGNPVATALAEEYLGPIRDEGVDTLILGCTHYPILSEIIADVMGSGVTLISSGREAANAAYAMLTKADLLTTRTEKGKNSFFVSDSAAGFSEQAKALLGGEAEGEIAVQIEL